MSSNYEVYKALSHAALAIFIILSPHFESPKNLAWKGSLTALKGHIEVFKDAAVNADVDQDFRERLLSLVSIYLTFLDTLLAAGTFTVDYFLEFTAEAFSIIRINMAGATAAQVTVMVIVTVTRTSILAGGAS